MPIEPASPEAIARAADLLRQEQLVAFPTETVYGLGANALSPLAVAKIYALKGRPANNPLIVHVLGAEGARALVEGWDDRAERLAAAFWPGPLTLVLGRGARVPSIVAAGGPTLALRAPSHSVARALLEAFGGPIAAPSANRSTAVSPTRAEHVLADLGAAVPSILDGGPCQVGLESTVLSLAGAPRILRPGAITPRALGSVLGEAIATTALLADELEPAPAPGMQARHYAPGRPVILFRDRAELSTTVGARVAILTVGPIALERAELKALPAEPEGYARELYAALRWADRPEISAIWVELPPESEAWAGAILDRLRRAAVV